MSVRLALAAALLAPLCAGAADSSSAGISQPYIDQLRQHIESEDAQKGRPAPHASGTPGSSPFIDGKREELRAQPGWVEDTGYSEKLKQSLGAPEKSSEGYSQDIRSKLEPKTQGGAIKAVLENRSELSPKKSGEIHYAAGFRLNASRTLNITGTSGAVNGNFSDYYPAKYTPELALFMEYQPFHSEVFGNVGIIGQVSFSYALAKGRFPAGIAGSLSNPFGGNAFTLESQTNIRFITVPVSLGGIYRFNLPQIIRPYVMAAPTLITYGEFRDDEKPERLGYSTGMLFSGGLNLELDRIFKAISWDLYRDYGIHKFYLTLDYSKLATVAGDVKFDRSVISVGMTYEY